MEVERLYWLIQYIVKFNVKLVVFISEQILRTAINKNYSDAALSLSALPNNFLSTIHLLVRATAAAANAQLPATLKQAPAPLTLCNSPNTSGEITLAQVLTAPSNPITAPLL